MSNATDFSAQEPERTVRMVQKAPFGQPKTIA